MALARHFHSSIAGHQIRRSYTRHLSPTFPSSVSLPGMSLSMNGSQITIEGGTFNNVAGNLNQTSTTIISESSSHRGALRLNGYPEDRVRDHRGTLPLLLSQ
jgi:hypothetical protein